MEMRDIEIKIENYKEVVLNFSELLKFENKALSEYDTELVGKIYPQKAKIVGAYRSLVAYFIKNNKELESLDEDTKEEIRELSNELNFLLQENDRLLKTKMETSKTVLESIVNIVKVTTKSNSTSYGAHGGYSPLDNSKHAISFNRTL